MRYLKYSSSIITGGFFCYIVGASVTLVGRMSSPSAIYTAWDIVRFIGTVAILIWLGFSSGKEYERNSKDGPK